MHDDDLGSLAAVLEPHGDPCLLSAVVADRLVRPRIGEAARAIYHFKDTSDPQHGPILVLVGEPIASAHAQIDLGGSKADPTGPHHFSRCTGSVQATKTASLEAGIVLNFDHNDFASVDGFRAWTIGWATKMLALKRYAETGKRDPFA